MSFLVKIYSYGFFFFQSVTFSSQLTTNTPEGPPIENYIGRLNTISQKKNLCVTYEKCKSKGDGPEG